jgi:hypothetical protein
MLSGNSHTLDLPVSNLQLHRFEQGASITACFPTLTAAQREFIKTGITEEEWNGMFAEDEV